MWEGSQSEARDTASNISSVSWATSDAELENDIQEWLRHPRMVGYQIPPSIHLYARASGGTRDNQHFSPIAVGKLCGEVSVSNSASEQVACMLRVAFGVQIIRLRWHEMPRPNHDRRAGENNRLCHADTFIIQV